jgi:hypothetical protein
VSQGDLSLEELATRLDLSPRLLRSWLAVEERRGKARGSRPNSRSAWRFSPDMVAELEREFRPRQAGSQSHAKVAALTIAIVVVSWAVAFLGGDFLSSAIFFSGPATLLAIVAVPLKVARRPARLVSIVALGGTLVFAVMNKTHPDYVGVFFLCTLAIVIATIICWRTGRGLNVRPRSWPSAIAILFVGVALALVYLDDFARPGKQKDSARTIVLATNQAQLLEHLGTPTIDFNLGADSASGSFEVAWKKPLRKGSFVLGSVVAFLPKGVDLSDGSRGVRESQSVSDAARITPYHTILGHLTTPALRDVEALAWFFQWNRNPNERLGLAERVFRLKCPDLSSPEAAQLDVPQTMNGQKLTSLTGVHLTIHLPDREEFQEVDPEPTTIGHGTRTWVLGPKCDEIYVKIVDRRYRALADIAPHVFLLGFGFLLGAADLRKRSRG